MSETKPTTTSASTTPRTGSNLYAPIIVDGKDITQPNEKWIGKCTPTPKKKNAAFWRAFHIAIDERNEPGKLRAVCNICGGILTSHNSGTTNLRRHMHTAHPPVYEKLLDIQQSERGTNATFATNKKKRSASSAVGASEGQKAKKAKKKGVPPIETAEMAQAMYCISANRPFSDLDQPAMKAFVEACAEVGRVGGGFVPSAAVARSKVSNAAKQAKVTIKGKLKEAKKLVLSIDLWETENNQNSAYISVRWVEGFELFHCFLNDVKYVGEANAEEIVETVTETLKKWAIQDEIKYLVSNLDISKHEFVTNNKIEFIESLDWGWQSVIDASVSPTFGSFNDSKGETASSEFGKVLQNARKAAKVSTNRIIAGGVNRWWSCFAMIEGLLQNRAAPADEADNDSSNKQDDSQNIILEEDDWEKLQLMKDALTPFIQGSKMLSGNIHCNSSLVPFIQFVVHSEISQMVKKEGTSKLGTLASKILKSFEAKFGKGVTLTSDSNTSPGLHKHILLAHALDPRFKQLKVLADVEDKETLWNILLEEMVALGPPASYESKGKPTAVVGDEAAAFILRGVATIEEGKREETKDSIFDQYAGVLENGPSKGETVWKIDCMNELNLYRVDSTVGMRTENGKEDPLSWWKSHRVAFPTLFKLAKIYLAIPANSTGPRMAFNTLESEMALKRYMLSDDLPDESNFLFENSWILEEYSGLYTS